jgi:NADPH-dependent curcumin reductase CurA
VIYGRCVGEVVESRHPDYQPGDIVHAESRWQQYCLSDGSARDQVRKINPEVKLSAYLGPLGMPGLTAWAGVEKLAPPQLGDTFVVSSAAGAVGSVAGQLAKIKGARAVGIAGSGMKCDLVVDTYRFDACVNYKTDGWLDNLKTACPGGIDVYYDNVNGPMLDAVAGQLAMNGRVVMCGFTGLATPGWKGNNVGIIVGKRAQYFSMIVYDYLGHWDTLFKAVTPFVKSGRLAIHEDSVAGLENAPAHFVKLMKGENVGKALVAVAPENAS